MSPKTWMRTVYFQKYLKLDILARLDVGYLMYKINKYRKTKISDKLMNVRNSNPELKE